MFAGKAKQPSQPDPEPQKPEPQKPDEALEEVPFTDLQVWRIRKLLRLQFTLEQAVQLSNRADVEHDADRLLARGCPIAFVFEELRPW